MSTIHWAFGVSGNWNTPADWSGDRTPNSTDVVAISAAGQYTVEVNGYASATSLVFDAANAVLAEATTGQLDIGSSLDLRAGAVILRGFNQINSVTESGGSLQLYTSSALGGALVDLKGGELTGMATEVVPNYLTIAGDVILDAATGTTVDFGGSRWSLDATTSPTLQFGSAARRGTVIWHSGTAALTHLGTYQVDVAGGTLRAADNHFSFLFEHAGATTLAAGATIDLNGHSASMNGLAGGGAIVDGGAAAALILDQANFAGAVSGPIGVEIATNSMLEGVNGYTGGTTIDSGQRLTLTSHGSLVGPVFDDDALFLQTTATLTPGAISGSGFVSQYGPGSLVLDHADSYIGGTNLYGGKVLIGSGAALGTGRLLVAGGELIGTKTETVANLLTFAANATVAAGAGATLTLTGGSLMTWDAGASALDLTFGDGGHTGTVVLAPTSVDGFGSHEVHVKVAYGTLKASGSELQNLTQSATYLKVLADAKLDMGGADLKIPNLASAGSIANSAVATATLFTAGASSAAGSISGKIRVDVANGELTLTGADTYSGGTVIESGATLQLGAGGAGGSIVGAVDGEGTLALDRSSAFTLAGPISGAGSLVQQGTGIVTINAANSYAGGTTIKRGEIIAGQGAALGKGGVLTLTGGELLASATEVLSHDLHTGGGITIAAVTGHTLTLATGADTFDAGTTYLGEGAHEGTIVFKASGGETFSSDPLHTHIEVRAGTLKAGDLGLGRLTANAETRIDGGASLDIAGHAATITVLTGSGALTNSGAAAQLTLLDASFSGVISGKYAEVDLYGANTLSADQIFTGQAVIEGGATRVTLSGLFAESVEFKSGGTLVLLSPPRFTGILRGFAAGAMIDLRNVTTGSAATLSYSAGVLTVRDGTHTDKLSFAGSYALGNFAASSDGAGGTNIKWQAAAQTARPPGPVVPFVSAMAGFGAPVASASAPNDARPGLHTLLSRPSVRPV